ncbi:hypothetical protein [Burkholderia sp. WSM2232]|uniref:hypothetical protein n=1 Tax=Burkholderia sp. WSM2232 TaxID=944436 RepID=UPI0004262FE5|nr:hypothetical protein [Burkholderia sp. WSM2232]
MCAICDFKIEFGVGHPQALAVAVATRRAIEAGLLRQLEIEEGALAQARMRMTAVDTLKDLQSRVQQALTAEELQSLPDFYILLIENETWGFFHATEDGFDPDIMPEPPDVLSEDVEARSLVIVTSQVAMQAWLDTEIDTAQLQSESLLFMDGPLARRSALLSMLATSAAITVAEPVTVPLME